ncbi:SUKH-4 family immunity protein [Streptomyces sp. NPDC005408]|uniref:SUKH-4 family immunity protein n=1 Tax=Streptomyces sp. NPDC005408 TaxID=3155341 RepID=UPI0033B3481A
MEVVARWELDEAFGEDDVIVMDYELTGEFGAAPLDRRVLAYVGLPRRVGSIFTTEVVGSPELFAVREFELAGGNKSVLALGGPPDDERMRFFLDLQEGFVVLISFHEGGAQAEIVNSSLDDFVEFLYRFGLRDKDLSGASIEEDRQYTAGFVEVLKEFDPFAFSQPDSWWSMAIDRIKK